MHYTLLAKNQPRSRELDNYFARKNRISRESQAEYDETNECKL